MSKPTNELLGEVRCIEPGCGGVEYVYQSKRKGRHLYGRCSNCGINQKTGKNVQERLSQYVPVGTLPKVAPEPETAEVVEAETVESVTADEPLTITPAPVPAPTTANKPPRWGLMGLVLGLISFPFLLSRLS